MVANAFSRTGRIDETLGGFLSSLVHYGLIALVIITTLGIFGVPTTSFAAIIGAAGLAIGLALLSVALNGYPFGFMTIVGAMGLVGVAINDSIVVLAALRASDGARRGELDTTLRVVSRASRHIVSTTLTTAAGFTPLILAGGGFWPPVAVAIGGGVAGATLVALTLVPTLHLWISRREVRRRARREARGAAPVVHSPPEPVDQRR